MAVVSSWLDKGNAADGYFNPSAGGSFAAKSLKYAESDCPGERTMEYREDQYLYFTQPG
jgi:hypothetical protein